MKTKPGVSLFGLQLPMRFVLVQADRIWRRNGIELTITSTVEGVHSPRSLHPFGYAVDFRIRDFPEAQHRAIAQELGETLGSQYRVLLEVDHIHVEYRAVLDA